MQYTNAWGMVQEEHRPHQQQQQQQQLPLTSCYMPSPNFMSPPPPYMEYLQPPHPQQQQQRIRNSPAQLLPHQRHPLKSPFLPNFNATGNEVQENMGINYVYSNSGKTFQYNLVTPTTSNATTVGHNHSQSRSNRPHHHQEYTSTTDINITTMNRWIGLGPNHLPIYFQSQENTAVVVVDDHPNRLPSF